jgi:benzoate membrane transport protein
MTFSLQASAAGLLAAFVGFAGAFAVVLKGLTGVGATPAQAATGLMAVTIAMGLAGIGLSLANRMPISCAWSTPGAALLAVTGPVEGGFAAAVGAFLVVAVLIIAAGLFKPLGRAIAAIPAPLANAMLAGILLGLCLAPAKAVTAHPVAALAMIVTWLVVARLSRVLAVPAAVAMLIGFIVLTTPMPAVGLADLLPKPDPIMPIFTLPALIGIALPLFVVNMASQNIPGMAVLNANGYHPPTRPIFLVTGALSLLAAPFGSHGVNLAAITAALCASPDAHPDPARRYWAAVVAGLFYLVLGLGAAAVTILVAAAPVILIEALAGLALLGSFAAATVAALAEPRDREAAVITFLVTASGLSLLGIGGAFWGLLAGGAVLTLDRWRTT